LLLISTISFSPGDYRLLLLTLQTHD